MHPPTRTFPKGFWLGACPGGKKSVQAQGVQLAVTLAQLRVESLGGLMFGEETGCCPHLDWVGAYL